jgi:alpha-glucuronidase
MKDGRTLLQRIYDDHFAGFAAAEEMARAWDGLEGRVPEDAYRRVRERFREQVRSAREWRDIINSWLYRLTLIPDEGGREIYL